MLRSALASALAALPKPQHTLQEYLEHYSDGHQHLGTKITHAIGIPMILAAFPTAVVSPPAGAALFVGGWAFQFVGHYVFEKDDPAFFEDPYYLFIGPVWLGLEAAELAGLTIPDSIRPRPPEQRGGVVASARRPTVDTTVEPLQTNGTNGVHA